MQGATKFIPKITSTNQPVFLLGRLTCCLKAMFKVDNYKLELAKAAIFTGRSWFFFEMSKVQNPCDIQV